MARLRATSSSHSALSAVAVALGLGASGPGSLAGCGTTAEPRPATRAANSADGGAGCTAASPGGGSASWTDDGVARCALVITSESTEGAAPQTFRLIAVDATGVSVTLTVSTYRDDLRGTYRCGADGGSGLEYVALEYGGGSESYVAGDCTIDINAAGSPSGDDAQGDFSATLTGATTGAVKVISDGVFDTPITVNPG